MKNAFFSLLAIVMTLSLAGCASSRSANVYSRDQARTAHTVQFGTVQAVQQVLIEGTKSNLGTATGGVAGGVLGSTVGGGSGRTLATVGGAIAGGLAGAAIEEQATRRAGLEITVQLYSGQTLVVVQEADEQFYPGERVRLISGSDGTTRVRH